MTLRVSLTRIPYLNDTLIIKQTGGHFFISAPDSLIIDKAGLLKLIKELLEVNYITEDELSNMFKGAR